MEVPTPEDKQPMAAPNGPFQRRYPPEMRERAVRMVREAIAKSGEHVGRCASAHGLRRQLHQGTPVTN
jgi:transposase-like protein